MKKILVFMLSALFMMGSISMFGCAKFDGEDVDDSKTQLKIANYNGGVGEKWLDNVAAEFEKKYKDISLEDGKTGVQVHITHDKTYDGVSLTGSLTSDDNDLYFTEQFSYYDNVSNLYDMTDLVTDFIGDDGKTIFSKMSETTRGALNYKGKYYALPFYELYSGVNYDAGLFAENNLYFADIINNDGTRPFVRNKNAAKSCGPDGEKGTYDDGLPSSYAEFERLIERMRNNNIIPFVWTGKSVHYTNQLISSLFANYVGKEGLSLIYNFEGGPLEVVTGFNGNDPVVTTENAIDKNNAYKIRSAVGLYYALELAQKIFTNSNNYYDQSFSGTFSHLSAMETLMNSGLDGKAYVAMLIDGNYWYNEASDDGIFERLQNDYPAFYTDKDIRFMPFPRQYSGTVTDGNGKSPVMVDTYNSLTFINKNTDELTADVAKKFLSFLYSDEQLKKFTVDTNGIVIGVDYDFGSVKDSVSAYSKSVLEMRDAAVRGDSFVKPISSDPIYLYNQNFFSLVSTSEFWKTTVNGANYQIACKAFRSNVSSKDYFLGMGLTSEQWQRSYNKY